jgi:hypothetical protein
MHVKFYAVHDPDKPDRWQVMAGRDGRDFLLAHGLTRKAALEHIRLAERVAAFCGAVVIA